MVTPGRISAPAQIQTLSPMVTGRAYSRPAARCSTSMACSSVMMQTLGAIKTLSPMVIFPLSISFPLTLRKKLSPTVMLYPYVQKKGCSTVQLSPVFPKIF